MINYKRVLYLLILCLASSPIASKKSEDLEFSEIEASDFESLDLDSLLEEEPKDSSAPVAVKEEKPEKKEKIKSKPVELTLPKDWKADKELKVSKKFGDSVSDEDIEVLRLEKIFDDDRLREINLQKLEGKKVIDLDIKEKIKKGTLELKSQAKKEAVAQKGVRPIIKDEKGFNFDLSKEEKELLGLAKYVEKKIPNKEWDEIAIQASDEKYIIQSGDWLWKISKRLFGTGFYYSKLWALNPHITNPHQIEPGMVLVFTTGSSDELPEVRLGTFEEEGKEKGKEKEEIVKKKVDPEDSFKNIASNLKKYGHKVEPPWIKERKNLQREGYYFEYASEETYEDLEKIAQLSLNDDYKKYNPPIPNILIVEPDETNVGFDKSSIVEIDIKEGFALTTFLTKNAIVDLGEIVDLSDDGHLFIKERERVYVKFNDNTNVQAGDLFSIYKFGGLVHYKLSDRKGYRYTIKGHVKVIRKFKDYWEVEVQDIIDVLERNERITFYVPKLRKTVNTFNRRAIEAAIVGSYTQGRFYTGLGDVAYLDRGRADGVEMGNVFHVYSFLKKGHQDDFPKKKIGSARVVTLMDDFSTVLITESSDSIPIGALASTVPLDRGKLASSGETPKGGEDVDIELHLKDSVKDVLANAKRVKLTEEELKELDRQEEKYSVIEDDERDIRELKRLEDEIVAAEKDLAESRGDEDKFLERQDLNELEKKRPGKVAAEDFAPINDIEGEVGLKFLDQELESRDNPYGLSEFDLEEIDELFNRTKL